MIIGGGGRQCKRNCGVYGEIFNRVLVMPNEGGSVATADITSRDIANARQ
jgi:hypothetical protein